MKYKENNEMVILQGLSDDIKCLKKYYSTDDKYCKHCKQNWEYTKILELQNQRLLEMVHCNFNLPPIVLSDEESRSFVEMIKKNKPTP